MIGDFLIFLAISVLIICIISWFCDMMYSRNKFSNCDIEIHIKYDDNTVYEAQIVDQTLKHIKDKYLIDAKIIYENMAD